MAQITHTQATKFGDSNSNCCNAISSYNNTIYKSGEEAKIMNCSPQKLDIRHNGMRTDLKALGIDFWKQASFGSSVVHDPARGTPGLEGSSRHETRAGSGSWHPRARRTRVRSARAQHYSGVDRGEGGFDKAILLYSGNREWARYIRDKWPDLFVRSESR